MPAAQNEPNDIPVYLFTGFLEAGKTKFIQETMEDKRFNSGEPTLLLLCEEGEEEYDVSAFPCKDVFLHTIEDQEDFNPENLQKILKSCGATRVVLEYNGMWSLRTMAEKAPKDWIFYQIFMFVDHSKYQVYMNNMRQLLSDNFSVADIVVFNRCEKNKVDKKSLRRSIKALNPKIDMMFEYTDGSIEQGFQGDDEMPYDLNADPIEIVHDDFGLWYVDIMSTTDRYVGRNVHVRGMVFRASNVPKGYFVISRRAMTCCADDIQVVGILVKSPDEANFKNGDWVEVTGRVIVEKQTAYRGEGPVIAAREIKAAEPAASELVYFS